MLMGPTVFVIDDDEPSRLSVAAMVEANGMEAEVFSSAEQFLAHFDRQRWGCIVSDYRMPGINGLQLQDRLVCEGCGIPIIMVSGYADITTAVRLMRNGGVTLLEKPYGETELIDAIREALMIGEQWRQAHQDAHQAQDRLGALTPEERAVMEKILQGWQNKRIAVQLDMSLRTVERRRHRIFEKLQVESILQLKELVGRAAPRAGLRSAMALAPG